MNNKIGNNTKKALIKVTIILGILICFSHVFSGLHTKVQATTDNQVTTTNEQKVVYLSDIPYDSPDIEEKSSVGWGSITMDRNLETQYNNGLISLKINGKNKQFLKGISAHANSKVIFDVSKLVEQGFTKFSTYYGVDSSRSGGAGQNAVYFKMVTKTDANSPWQTVLEPTANMKGNSEAGFIEIDLKGKKYIKLEAYGRGGISSAHACYANAKLYKEGYEENNTTVDFIKTLDEYDRIIKEKYSTNKFDITGEYELTLLQREFVKNIGYDLLQQYVALNQDNLNIVKWLITDIENLKPYMMGGKPSGGSYFSSLKVLSRLYKERGEDLKDTTEITTTRGKSTLGNMYKTMMLSLSLTHSGNVYLWITGGNYSDPVNRYDIYKRLYHGKVVADETTTKGIGSDLIEKNKFASLHVEEMRWVMNTIIDDEEIEWLNWFAREKKNGATGPYSYIRYTFGYNYNKDQYYTEENYDKWNEKYNLSKYNITYRKGNPKIWIVLEEGAVCGGLSKTGACVWGSFKGLPNSCVSQPGHCAYIFYNQDANGNGVWGLGNDVGGWHQAGRTEHLNSRMPLGWGNQAYIDFNKDWLGMATYVLLAQGALNQYDNFAKSQEILMLVDVYKDDTRIVNEIYDKALEVLPINIDAWYGKIKEYRKDETKTSKDYYAIAEGIFENLKLYPLPMYHIAREVQKNLTDAEYQFKFTLDQTKALNYAKNHSNESIQSQAVKQEAQHLLGQIDTNLATFSFDGENAGAIKLGQRFAGSDVAWDYCLDGNVNNPDSWIQATDAYEAGDHVQKLTKEQLNSITPETDIYVHIIGVDYSEDNLFKIDITNQNLLSNLYANDLENRIVGVNLTTEWRYTENDKWTSYSKESPDLTGNKTVQVRQAATGTKLASPVSEVYTFTEDNQPDTRKYITVSHLAVQAYSTQSKDSGRPFYAPNAIDANINTIWHTDFSQNVLQQTTKPFYTIKLDEPRYISAVEFTQRKYRDADPAYIKHMTVYVSEDGENWTQAGRKENCQQNNDMKVIDFKESIKGQYVKLEMDTYDMFASLAIVNLFEDTTKREKTTPTAGIAYSTKEKTNQPVIARITNPSTKITITKPKDGSDSYVFTENGSFTFEFVDKDGNKGKATATVDWIDKSGPTADIEYKLSEDKKLIAILDNISEDSYLLDSSNKKANYIEVENGKAVSISFLDSNENVYKIADVDENRVTTKITYKNLTGKVDRVAYYVNIPRDENEEQYDEQYLDENGNQITDLTDAEKADLRKLQQITRSNPLEHFLDDNEEYEFKLLDKANNVTYKNIKVDYIDLERKILVSDITYSTTMLTNEDVIATIKTKVIGGNGKECSKVVNNNGSEMYTFKKNGTFTFKYAECGENESDPASEEVKTHTANVTWIDKTNPTAQIKYSTKEATKESVVASLVNESEAIIVTNNGGKREYTFTENGKFTFEFIDKAGNKGTTTATVTWIKSEEDPEDVDKITSEKYLIKESYISKILPGTTVKKFKENIQPTNIEMTILDKEGNRLDDNSIITTDSILKISDALQYTLVVVGDIDCDGDITINDLAQMKLHIIDISKLTGSRLKAADINMNNDIEVGDLAQMKLHIIGISELTKIK